MSYNSPSLRRRVNPSARIARGKRMGYRQGKFAFRYVNFLG